MSDYNPSDHTVDEVVEYAEDHPDEVQEIRDAEAAGKARVTLLDKLDSMLAEQVSVNPTAAPVEPPPEEAPPVPQPVEPSEADRQATFRTP